LMHLRDSDLIHNPLPSLTSPGRSRDDSEASRELPDRDQFSISLRPKSRLRPPCNRAKDYLPSTAHLSFYTRMPPGPGKISRIIREIRTHLAHYFLVTLGRNGPIRAVRQSARSDVCLEPEFCRPIEERLRHNLGHSILKLTGETGIESAAWHFGQAGLKCSCAVVLESASKVWATRRDS
jgi:hypothetical protein